MNTLGKLGVAAALTMSYVSAHAALVGPTSTSPGDVLLFAEVLNSSGSIIGSYAGDTGTTVKNGLTSINSISASTDANLQSLLSLGASSGNTIEWGVQGGGSFNSAGTANYGNSGQAGFVTTIQVPASFQPFGVNLNQWAHLNGQAGGTVQQINNNLAAQGAAADATSIFSGAASSGGIWDSTVIGSSNVQNWYSNGGPTAVTGLGSATLYFVSGNGLASAASIGSIGTATLSQTGFSFSAGTAPVPLPAAVWLLGSGLLGLAGVGRRKQRTAA
ncbi:MAG TPA: VPLPA-CTERM sorting domain-containing protein [Steroidobacteraceae bacterium]|jgi:hypothetical protein